MTQKTIEGKKTKVPNPGSEKARAMGCTCPVLDNNCGKGDGTGLFWMNTKCPVHGTRQNDTDDH